MKKTLAIACMAVGIAILSGCRTKPHIGTFPAGQAHNWPSKDWAMVYGLKGIKITSINEKTFEKPYTKLYLKPGQYTFGIYAWSTAAMKSAKGQINATLEPGIAYSVRAAISKPLFSNKARMFLDENPRLSADSILEKQAKERKPAHNTGK